MQRGEREPLSLHPFETDGRWITFGFLATYFLSIFLSSFIMEYDLFWQKYLRVCTSRPAFLDMHHLTSGLECSELGYDVLIENPCEPNQLPMTYPRIWLHLAKLGINQSHGASIALAMIAFFFIFVFKHIGRLTKTEGFLYGLVLCSPPIMLAVETGNIDLIVFFLLGCALLISQSHTRFRSISYLLILLAAILKYFPIAAILSVLRETKKRSLLILSVSLGMFLIYLSLTLEEFVLIQQQRQRSTYLSYGGRILFNILEGNSAGSFLSFPHYIWTGLYFFFLLTLVSFAVFYSRRGQSEIVHTRRIDGFRYGAAIYIVSFALWENWDYRLIFLLFALPQILEWAREGNRFGRLSQVALIALPVAFWLSSLWPPDMNFRAINRFFLDELIHWFLFFYMTYALLLTLPSWLKVLETSDNADFAQQAAGSASNLGK